MSDSNDTIKVLKKDLAAVEQSRIQLCNLFPMTSKEGMAVLSCTESLWRIVHLKVKQD